MRPFLIKKGQKIRTKIKAKEKENRNILKTTNSRTEKCLVECRLNQDH